VLEIGCVWVENVSTTAAVSLIVTISCNAIGVCSEALSYLIITTDISKRFWIFGCRQGIQFPSSKPSPFCT